MSTVGPHVFGDGRLHCWIINPAYLAHRAPLLRDRFGVTDFDLPEHAGPEHKDIVRGLGCFVATWTTPAKRGPIRYAAESLAAMDRMGSSVLEANIEGEDAWLTTYIPAFHSEIRKKRRAMRLRINVVPFKGKFLPASLWVDDPNLFIIVQGNYLGNMAPSISPADAVYDLLEHGIPLDKIAVQYGAHVAPALGDDREPALPGWIRRRASIYQDDLMADAGYLA